MCRATAVGDEGGFRSLPPLGGRKRLEVRAFYLRLSSSSSSSSAAAAPAELTLVYRPAIGGPALGFRGRALPPASPAESPLLRLRADDDAAAAAYASNDRVSASEGARFEVYAGKELAAEGVFFFFSGGWRVECRRVVTAAVAVAEVVVLAEGGALFSARASSSAARRCAARLEGIPEEASSWGSSSSCDCGTCSEDWEVVEDDDSDDEWKEEAAAELETVRWALEMGAWAVCVGVGLLATARRFRRRRALR